MFLDEWHLENFINGDTLLFIFNKQFHNYTIEFR